MILTMPDDPRCLARRRFCRGVGGAIVGLAIGCRDERLPGYEPGGGYTPDLTPAPPVDAATAPSDLVAACAAGGLIVAGAASGFAVGTATFVSGGAGSPGVFVCRDAGGLYALSPLCTHTGCNVSFVSSSSGFACPCHGGTYDFGGAVTGGPPPRGLTHVAVCVDGAGNVTVSTSAPVPASQRA